MEPPRLITDYPALQKDEQVVSPPHYNEGDIECIQAIEASMSAEEFLGYCKGSVMKYLWRYRRKGHPLQDLQKASWYTDRLMSALGRKK